MAIRDRSRLAQGKGTQTGPAQALAPLSSSRDQIRHRFGRTLTPDKRQASARWASIPNRLAYRLVEAGESGKW